MDDEEFMLYMAVGYLQRHCSKPSEEDYELLGEDIESDLKES